MKAKLTLVVVCCLSITSFTNPTKPSAVNAYKKVMEHYGNQTSLQLQYDIFTYEEEDSEGKLATSILLYLEGDEMYYQTEEKEYFQNADGTLILHLREKQARIVPRENPKEITNEESKQQFLSLQIEQLIDLSDSFYYFDNLAGKEVYKIDFSNGYYSTIELHLNDDFSLSKMVYYYASANLGHKSEMLVSAIPKSEIDQIKSKVKRLNEGFDNSTLQQLYKDFEFLENE